MAGSGIWNQPQRLAAKPRQSTARTPRKIGCWNWMPQPTLMRRWPSPPIRISASAGKGRDDAAGARQEARTDAPPLRHPHDSSTDGQLQHQHRQHAGHDVEDEAAQQAPPAAWATVLGPRRHRRVAAERRGKQLRYDASAPARATPSNTVRVRTLLAGSGPPASALDRQRAIWAASPVIDQVDHGLIEIKATRAFDDRIGPHQRQRRRHGPSRPADRRRRCTLAQREARSGAGIGHQRLIAVDEGGIGR